MLENKYSVYTLWRDLTFRLNSMDLIQLVMKTIKSFSIERGEDTRCLGILLWLWSVYRIYGHGVTNQETC